MIDHRSHERDPLDQALYVELRRIAGAIVRGESEPRLTPTEVVHEYWLKLNETSSWEGTSKALLRQASTAMRNLVLDAWRASNVERRGGQRKRVSLSLILREQPEANEVEEVDLNLLGPAMDRLGGLFTRPSKVAEMRLFMEASHEQIAEALDISVRTSEREWALARSWLRREMNRPS